MPPKPLGDEIVKMSKFLTDNAMKLIDNINDINDKNVFVNHFANVFVNNFVNKPPKPRGDEIVKMSKFLTDLVSDKNDINDIDDILISLNTNMKARLCRTVESALVNDFVNGGGGAP